MDQAPLRGHNRDIPGPRAAGYPCAGHQSAEQLGGALEPFPAAATRGVLLRFVSGSLPLLALVLLVAHGLAPGRLHEAGLLAAALHALVTGLAAWGLWLHYPHDRLGRANLVTQLRAALVAALAASLVQPPLHAPAAAMVAGLAALALALDGVDGWLARRDGLVSAFGARFDMEIDSLLALLLAGIAWRMDLAGPGIMLLGVPRYAFLLAGLGLPFLRAPLPGSTRRKLGCVVQIAALILLVAPWPGAAIALPMALGAGLFLYASFALDMAWLWRHRP